MEGLKATKGGKPLKRLGEVADLVRFTRLKPGVNKKSLGEWRVRNYEGRKTVGESG